MEDGPLILNRICKARLLENHAVTRFLSKAINVSLAMCCGNKIDHHSLMYSLRPK